MDCIVVVIVGSDYAANEDEAALFLSVPLVLADVCFASASVPLWLALRGPPPPAGFETSRDDEESGRA